MYGTNEPNYRWQMITRCFAKRGCEVWQVYWSKCPVMNCPLANCLFTQCHLTKCRLDVAKSHCIQENCLCIKMKWKKEFLPKPLSASEQVRKCVCERVRECVSVRESVPRKDKERRSECVHVGLHTLSCLWQSEYKCSYVCVRVLGCVRACVCAGVFFQGESRFIWRRNSLEGKKWRVKILMTLMDAKKSIRRHKCKYLDGRKL